MKSIAIIASMFLHGAVLYAMSQLPTAPRRDPSTIVEMTVKQTTRPPPPPPPTEEVVPPPEVVPKKVRVRTAKEIVPDAPPPAPPPEKPRFAFSVDMASTVEGGGVEVPAIDGGGNMFADPEKDAALPAGKATEPQAPPGGQGLDGPPDGYQITEEPKFVTPESERAPPYPDEARAKEIEGTVLLRVYVSVDGQVKHVKVVQPLGGGCTQAAVGWAKRKWRFEPAKAGAEAVGMWITVPMKFVLER